MSQWLGLGALTVVAWVPFLVGELRSHMNHGLKKNRCDVYIHTHTPSGILAIKMSEILSFAVAWMDLEGIMLSEISQTEREI